MTLVRAVAVILVALAAPGFAAWRQAPAGVPDRLTDKEFWALSQDSSEPGGQWNRADIINVTSNELTFQQVIPDLLARVRPGGVYLGVGPEQNFTYIAVTRPRFAVIFDIRRGNLVLQLLYKAIFELSKDRAGFMTMLFSKPQPPGVRSGSSAAEIFDAFAAGPPATRVLFTQHLATIKEHLVKTRRLPLPESDLASIEYIYERLFIISAHEPAWREYRTLMTGTDATGSAHSFLATESRFAFVRDLQSRNLIVPIVGDFAGPTALRSVGQYLKAKGAIVSTFYLSNVEEYLRPFAFEKRDSWRDFCRNVVSLPLDATSTFVRSTSQPDRSFINSLGSIVNETRGCAS